MSHDCGSARFATRRAAVKHYGAFCCTGCGCARSVALVMQLYDSAGRRKYLTPAERQEFLRAAENAPHAVRTFCATLAHTGCRISEALALTAARVDLDAGVLVFESLKKRRKGIYRAVPVPPNLLETLEAVHDLGGLG